MLAPAVHAGHEESRQARTEFTPAPLIGGNSDIGFGGGAIASIARIVPGLDPYLYRFELSTTTTLKSERGSLVVPYQDDYLLVALPHLLGDRLKLELRVSYTRETTQKYYGVGNAAPLPDDRSLDDAIYEYDRTHAAASADGTLRLSGPLAVELRISYVQNWLRVPPGTKLADDASRGSTTVRNLIPTLEPRGTVTFTYGVVLDTRDDKVSPTRGHYDATRVDLSPGGTEGIPQRWGRWDTNLRTYVRIGNDGSALALRGVADLLFGNPPFYELARVDDSSALGGPNGVRGVPEERYHGMVKLFGNLELRKMLFTFRFLAKDNHFGLVAFADAGRVFATYTPHPELDGTSLGLKFGLGGGMRLVAGQSFVLRADAAWSPDARPIGVYVAAGQTF